ncbi:OmpH family outer membrane protein [Polaribacter sp. HaHaR_3_91]|uniref:OmpH family outer membrane protein n=1 Tax=Polaribacter sp. HaHaR_3_91 TaxID=2745561 RepID=UPI001C4EBCB1|nr:OmpH family outer membrane protein [Polaribacter sp. HaHaR_3_91]QXP63107.1 OmpH family outer membrane protein [Polaribacter sp. HaHaR_3_91]
MKKIFLVIVLLLSVTFSWSQRGQSIAYIDMEYILENVPEYLDAQNTLDAKVAKWRKKLDEQARHIEILKTDLANEKAILTKDLIEEKEEEISLKQVELRRLESLYFGPNGDMFSVRKQLVKPIQDQVYNAIQSISLRKNYDFVFDKSTDLVMLYSNKKYDISDLVLATIDRSRLIAEKEKQREERNLAPKNELTDRQKEAIAKKEQAQAKKIADVEAKKKLIAEKREKLLKDREEKRELLRAKKEALRKKKEEQKEEQE